MSEAHRLEMTRHYLFEVEPCVSFVAKMKHPAGLDELNKALRKLCVREPLITAAIELDDDGTASFVTGRVSCSFSELGGELPDIIIGQRGTPFDVSRALFRFFLINGDSVGIFAHVAAADSKSLAFLAGELAGYVSSTLVSVEPSELNVSLTVDDFPDKCITPITFNLGDSLNEKWERHPSSFTLADYSRLHKAYSEKRGKTGMVFGSLDEKETAVLAKLANAGQIDYSSLLLAAFWEVLERSMPKRKKNTRKVVINTSIGSKLCIPLLPGAGNHSSRLEFTPPKPKNDRAFFARAQVFHKELYLKHINEFSRFAYLTFFCGIDGFLADASYFSAYCGLSSKPAKRIAKIKSSLAVKWLGFGSLNLTQKHWEPLNAFSDVIALEPFFPEHELSLSCVRSEDKTGFVLCWCEDTVSGERAQQLMDETLAVLRGILK